MRVDTWQKFKKCGNSWFSFQRRCIYDILKGVTNLQLRVIFFITIIANLYGYMFQPHGMNKFGWPPSSSTCMEILNTYS